MALAYQEKHLLCSWTKLIQEKQVKHTFERYCKDYENIENYEAAKKDNFKGWECHHRLETHNSDGERRLVDITQKELKALGMYYNRPAEELIFLTTIEHNAYDKGKQKSEETRKKIAEANKGTRWFNNGIKNVRAKECPDGFVQGKLLIK